MNWMGGVKRRAQKRKESAESKQRKYFEQRRKTRNLGSMQNDFAFEESVAAGKDASAFDESTFPFRPELNGAVAHSSMEELYHPIKETSTCTASLDVLALSKNNGTSCSIPLASLPRTRKNSSQQQKTKEKNGWDFPCPARSLERIKKAETNKELNPLSQEPSDECPRVVVDNHGETCLTSEQSNAQLHQTIQQLSNVISQQQEMISSLQQQLSEASYKKQTSVTWSGRSPLTPEVTRSGGDKLASSADESPLSGILSGYKVSKAPVTINICAGSLSMMNGNGSMNIMRQEEKRASSFAASQPEFRMHRRDFELEQETQAHALVLPQGAMVQEID